MKGQSGIVQALGAENRMLRNKIGQLEQSQQQGMFLETLTAHALGGLLSVKGVDVKEAAAKAVEAASAVFDKVVAEGRAALAAEEQAGHNDRLKDDDEEAEAAKEPGLIIAP